MTPWPSVEEIEAASDVQLARWYRHLPSPNSREELQLMNRIIKRFNEVGGMAPKLSKLIGW